MNNYFHVKLKDALPTIWHARIQQYSESGKTAFIGNGSTKISLTWFEKLSWKRMEVLRYRLCKRRVPEYFAKINLYLRCKKVNENKVWSYCETIRCMQIHIYKHDKKQWNICLPLRLVYKPTIIPKISKNGPTYRRQVVDPRHQTPKGQIVAKPGTPLWNIRVENLNIIQRSAKATCSVQYYKKDSWAETTREVRNFCRTKTS